jgi:hypothetical protein
VTGNTGNPQLQRIHSDAVYQSGSARLALEYWRKQPTSAIVDSLRPGQPESLMVKPDGRIMNGNTRVKVLVERGYDIGSLPRDPIP